MSYLTQYTACILLIMAITVSNLGGQTARLKAKEAAPTTSSILHEPNTARRTRTVVSLPLPPLNQYYQWLQLSSQLDFLLGNHDLQLKFKICSVTPLKETLAIRQRLSPLLDQPANRSRAVFSARQCPGDLDQATRSSSVTVAMIPTNDKEAAL